MNILGLLGAIGLSVVTSTNVISTSTNSANNIDTYQMSFNNLNDFIDLSYINNNTHPTYTYNITQVIVGNDDSIDKRYFSNMTYDNYNGMYADYDLFVDIYEDRGQCNYAIDIRYNLVLDYNVSGSTYTLKRVRLQSVYFRYIYFNKDNFQYKLTNCYSNFNAFNTTSTPFNGHVQMTVSPFIHDTYPFTTQIALQNVGTYTWYTTSKFDSGNSVQLDWESGDYAYYLDNSQYYMDLNPYSFGYYYYDIPVLFDTDNNINILNDNTYGFYVITTSRPVVLDTNSNYQSGYDNGHYDGYRQGYDEGVQDGFGDGYDSGKSEGYQEGINVNNPYTFGALFGAVADTPILIVRSLFNFDFFGVNLLPVVLSLFTAFILFYLIRKLL